MTKRNHYGGIARLGLAVATSVTLALAGCQSVSPGWRDDVRKSIDKEMDEATQQKGKPPADVSQALLPPLEIRLPDGRPTTIEPRFDLSVSNASARQVFMGLVEGTKYSMVVHPDVTGTVSLNLKNVTVPEALRAIREVYGYEFRRDGDRFFVLGREIQTRLFNVNYLNLVRRGKSDTRVTASGLSSTAGISAGSRTSTATTQSGVQVETQSQSEFWKDLENMLTALVGTEGGRKVIVNTQTGIIAVRAMPDELRLVEEYLGVTHATVNRQVVLEAKIIEVRLDDAFQAGINWARIGSNWVVGQVGGGTVFSGDGFTSGIGGNTGNLNPLIDTTIGTDVSAFGGVFTIAGGSNDFQAFVELLKAQGEVQVLSSPRVSTVNNQKAVIKVGTDEFFVIRQETTQSGVVGVLPTVTTELAPFFSGIALDVTPQIDESGNINLHIHPSVSDVAGKTIPISIATTDGSAQAQVVQQISTARSSVQESDSIVRAASGQIIVIGGLMKEGSTDQNASVPFVGDVPVVGNLFKQSRISRVKRELVILLKATVIEANEQWGDVASESRRRIDNMRPGK